MPDGVLRAHTFHHSRVETSLLPFARGERLYATSEGEPIYRLNRLVASYLHCYFTSNPSAAAALFLSSDPERGGGAHFADQFITQTVERGQS